MAMVLTDNSPGAGTVAWSGVIITFKGVDYAITNGNSAMMYVWWDFTNPNVFQESNTLPTLTDDDCVFLLNIDGVHKLIPGATIYNAELFSSIAPTVEFQQDIHFVAKTVGAAADRYKILSPNRMYIYFNSAQYYLSSQAILDLSLEATWDTIAGIDYRTAANRAGKDFYIYACAPVSGISPVLKVSVTATFPSGYDTTDSKKIGGFHCVCVAVGAIAGHTLTGYLAGDILPLSVWDLTHRPDSAPEGMVYDSGTGVWVDIYLASIVGADLASVNGGTIADGASATKFHWYKFSQWMARIKKKLPDQYEFVSLSLGANQGTNITGSADPGTTGGHSDTAARRMISNIGCEDCCGVLWQWGRDRGGLTGGATNRNAYDAEDTGVGGQHYEEPTCAFFGGSWDNGVKCGSRGSVWDSGPLVLYAAFGARGVSSNIGVRSN